MRQLGVHHHFSSAQASTSVRSQERGESFTGSGNLYAAFRHIASTRCRETCR
jgi:hypothetical protein